MHLGTYLFNCTLLDSALLPSYKGSTFRGAFGLALKRAVCVAKKQECTVCLLASRCIYALTFETGGGSASAPTPPVPYVIEPPLERRTRYNAGDSFDFSLKLFGQACQYLPYFIYAFEIMGEGGIGKKIDGQRGRFILDRVLSNDQIIYESSERKLEIPDSVNCEPPKPISSQAPPVSVCIKLITPLRLKYRDSLATELPFHLLVRALLRRISTLYEHFGDGEPPLDYRGIINRAQEVKILFNTLRWHDWERYSGRQEQSMMMGGLIGSITYYGELEEYLPLLDQCRNFHIGKQSSFGLGMFDYSIEDAERSSCDRHCL